MSEPTRKEVQVFNAALELSPGADRDAYLAQACAGDNTLRQKVEASLQARAGAEDFFKTGPAGARGTAAAALAAAATNVVSAPLTENPGDRIGRYKLLEQIGEGGFGVVWMAEQEEPVRRRVALKIIKLGMDTKEVVARFEAERQALAMMEHPNIARVFDGGATDTGRPFFVMELVKGVPITGYCDANKLSARERLALFVQVCQAVQHAHQKGVIHRDLKPSNILVTVQDDRPIPKVIDFGVAKATQARLTEKTVFTRFRQWIGTPAYMSPEQAGLGNLDVDTRSDVYSLGVLLYELLTGQTPFDAQKMLVSGYDAVMQTIREEDPLKPSTRLSTLAREELSAVAARRSAEPAKLGGLIRGDLDWIVMKCLEKDRARRYETANNVAQDIGRHLQGEPVSAAAPTALYLAQKFVRRHQTGLAMASAMALLLAAGTVISVWQAVRATRAEREQARLLTLAQYNLGVCYHEGAGVQKDFVEAVKCFRKAAQQNHPQAQWSLGFCYSKSQGVDKDDVEAVKWFRKAAEQNLAEAQVSLGNCYHNGDGVAKDAVEGVRWYRKAAEQNHPMAQNNLGSCYVHGQGVAKDDTEAVKWFRKAADQNFAGAQYNLGVYYSKGLGVEKDYVEAVKWYRKAAEQNLAAAQYNMGLCYQTGEGVEKDYVQAVKLYLKAAEQNDATAQCNLGLCYERGQGVEKNWAEAAKWFRKAAEQNDATAQCNLSLCYECGQGVEKDDVEAVKWLRRAAEQNHAQAQCTLGFRYWAGQGVAQNFAEAVRWYGKSAEQNVAAAQYNLGVCYARGQGVAEDDVEAVKWYRKAAEQNHAQAQVCLGFCYAHGQGVAKDELESVKWYRKAAEGGEASVFNSLAWHLATSANSAIRDGSNAVVFAEKAVSATSRKSPADLDTLAAAYAEAGQFEKAGNTEREAIALQETEATKNDYRTRLKLYVAKVPYRAKD